MKVTMMIVSSVLEELDCFSAVGSVILFHHFSQDLAGLFCRQAIATANDFQ
jgi:hypothetical protein